MPRADRRKCRALLALASPAPWSGHLHDPERRAELRALQASPIQPGPGSLPRRLGLTTGIEGRQCRWAAKRLPAMDRKLNGERRFGR